MWPLTHSFNGIKCTMSLTIKGRLTLTCNASVLLNHQSQVYNDNGTETSNKDQSGYNPQRVYSYGVRILRVLGEQYSLSEGGLSFRWFQVCLPVPRLKGNQLMLIEWSKNMEYRCWSRVMITWRSTSLPYCLKYKVCSISSLSHLPLLPGDKLTVRMAPDSLNKSIGPSNQMHRNEWDPRTLAIRNPHRRSSRSRW